MLFRAKILLVSWSALHPLWAQQQVHRYTQVQSWATYSPSRYRCNCSYSARATALLYLSVHMNNWQGELKIARSAKPANLGTEQNYKLNFATLRCPTKFNSSHLHCLHDMTSCLEQVLSREHAIHSFPGQVCFKSGPSEKKHFFFCFLPCKST